MPLQVLIVGAGIGGLTTAVALRCAGHNVLVLERRDHKVEVGFAVSLPPNSSRVMRGLGMDFASAKTTLWKGLDMIKGDCTPVQWAPQRDFHSEEIYGTPSMCVNRVDLHECLRRMAVDTAESMIGTPVEIREGVRVLEYDVKGLVTLESGEVITADLVVAADGVRSKAHKWIIGEEKPAQLSPLTSLRFVVPTETLLGNPKTAELIERGDQRAAVIYGSSNKVGLFRAPCRNNTLQSFGIFDIKDSNAADAKEWTTHGSKQMALDTLAGFDDSILEMIRLADEREMYLWRVADRDPFPRFQMDRLVLVGDACHPMQPHQGQGATQAIEDAGVLGAVMASVSRPEDIPARLQLWEELRLRRASAVQLLSRSLGMSMVLSEETELQVRALLTEDELPEITRPATFHYCFKYDCVAEAEKAVKEKFGANCV